MSTKEEFFQLDGAEKPEAPKRIPYKWIGLCYIGFLCSSTAMGVAGGIGNEDPEVVIEKDWNLLSDFLIFGVICYGIGIFGAFLLLRRLLAGRGFTLETLGLKKSEHLVKDLLIALACTALGLALFVAVEEFSKAIGLIKKDEVTSSFDLYNAVDVIVSLVGSSILVPLAEEVLFRGLIVTTFKARGKLVLGCCVSIACFTSVHMFFGPSFLLYIALWAIIPTYLFAKTENLFIPIVFHTLNNFLAYVLFPLAEV